MISVSNFKIEDSGVFLVAVTKHSSGFGQKKISKVSSHPWFARKKHLKKVATCEAVSHEYNKRHRKCGERGCIHDLCENTNNRAPVAQLVEQGLSRGRS